MRRKFSLLAVLLGVLTLALAATLAWSGPSDKASAANPTPTVIATVTVGDAPNGVAVNSVTGKIYVANEGGGTLSVIDRASLGVTTIALDGLSPRRVAVNPVTNLVYVTASANEVSVIDGTTDTEVDTDANPSNGVTRILVGSYPNFVAVNPETNRIYVGNSYSNSVSVIDGETYAVTDVPTGGISPEGIAVNPVTDKVYVNHNGGDLAVIDGATNAVHTIPIGGNDNMDVGVNPTTGRIYASRGLPGYIYELVVVDGTTESVIKTIDTGRHSLGVQADPTVNRVYMSNPRGVSGSPRASLRVIDGNQNATTDMVPVGAEAAYLKGVGVDPVLLQVYVANSDDDTVTVIQDYPPAVGGIAEYPELEPRAVSGGSGSSAPVPLALGALAAGGLLVAAGVWGMRRRRAG